ncbi:MAG TPA: 50S ribosomal protein L3 [Candidatus Nitrosocosmicus sp.]|nr:50S ribosomal protein L3 [Candidatus Nitrosocosmicus sp.]
MGHRKYSAPRRGSLAFYPRVRAKSEEARLRNWPELNDNTSLLGFAGFKAGQIQVMTIDDKEKTPNFGKQLDNSSTVIATPPINIIGIRCYRKDLYGEKAFIDAYSKDLPKGLERKFKTKYNEKSFETIESSIELISSFFAIVSVFPKKANLSQKKPFVFEIGVSGKDNKTKYEYLKGIIGKEIKISDVFQNGQLIDVSGITRGKGVEGPITRFGVKRKQHKSRKSVRALGTLGPISPAVVMYSVPRQGQRGFHQRTEYNKRILLVSSDVSSQTASLSSKLSINPSGGFKHFGLVTTDYIVVRGSIPGVPKRLVKMRQPIRNTTKKVIEPKVIEVIAK